MKYLTKTENSLPSSIPTSTPVQVSASGAWMTSYKEQWIDEKTGENSRPHVSVVMNFTKPTRGQTCFVDIR